LPLVGYECDGALFKKKRKRIKNPTGADGTPLDFVILGIGALTGELWQDFPGGNFTATMGLYANNETVFTSATTDWSPVRTNANSPEVNRITRNVLDRLKSRGAQTAERGSRLVDSKAPIDRRTVRR
jgi:hypothetical protein